MLRPPIIPSGPLLRSSLVGFRVRSYTQGQASRRGTIFTHILAGLAGGSIVVGAGYTWYYFSGVKEVVDATKQFKSYAFQTKNSVDERHPNTALNYLRTVVKSHFAIVPGSSFAVDRMFDAVDAVVAEHEDEAASILQRAKTEVEEVLRQRGNLTNDEVASRIMAIVGTRLAELGSLGAKAGGKHIDPLIQRLPDSAWWSDQYAQTREGGGRMLDSVNKKLSEFHKGFGNERAVKDGEVKGEHKGGEDARR